MKRYRVLSQTFAPPVERRDEAALAAHRDSLFARLESGYERINQGLREGQDVTSWEDFWIALLKEYERVCQALTEDLAAGKPREDWSSARADRLPGIR
jgi:hypothetical protein